MSKAKITLGEKEFEVSAKMNKVVSGFPNETTDNPTPHVEFRVKVKLDNLWTAFNFYASTHDYEQGKRTLEGDDLLFALRCLFDDALYGTYYLEDFADSLGYTEIKTAIRIHKECQKQLKRVLSLGVSEDEIADILNEMSNKDIC